MKIHELSVFLENRPGHLSVPCKALASAGINIVALSLSDTHRFGVLRLIVRDWRRARDVLTSAGCVVKVVEVVAVEVPDRPGGLEGVLEKVEAAGINVEYMYPLSVRRGGRAALLLRFDEPDRAVSLLRQAGADLIQSDGLFGD